MLARALLSWSAWDKVSMRLRVSLGTIHVPRKTIIHTTRPINIHVQAPSHDAYRSKLGVLGLVRRCPGREMIRSGFVEHDLSGIRVIPPVQLSVDNIL